MQEIIVGSWNELIDCLYEESWQPGIERFRSDFAFRGVANAEWSTFRTSLMRLGGSFQQMEGHLLRNFRKYAHLEATNAYPGDTAWHWLAMAQHHGLPTRLLDWSYSPFVAMHFATATVDQFDVDGLIWCVNYVRAHEYLPQPLRHVLEDEGANVFTAEMLMRGAATLPTFDGLAAGADDQPRHFATFFEPPSLDARIVNQYALFSLMSSPNVSLDNWLAEHPDLIRKIVIPAHIKWEVRDKLDQANVTERVLFPGLDGLSSWLRRQYTPRNGTPLPPEEDSGGHTTAQGVPREQG
ncbi:MAG: FRG domain-containing protein [Chloroflexota bacterium]|nr:FRG domain-containing protein [Chloroflexota bacterium]